MVSAMSAVKSKCNDDTEEGNKIKLGTALTELLVCKFGFLDNVQKQEFALFFPLLSSFYMKAGCSLDLSSIY